MSEAKYKRILLKLSGEALAGDSKKGIDPKEAIEKASGTYGRFDEAVKKIDPREA